MLEQLTQNQETPNILNQIHFLISNLCSAHNVSPPVELSTIAPISNDDRDEGNGSELESTVDEDDEEDLMCEMEDVEAARAQQHSDASASGEVCFVKI